ncbi:MAG: cbb3-type cytochrome c oxidase subunit I [Acidobacteria bacterium]|nr:cbb3-type cytochrome c oxidase subunit I [Acidobacteriota bacterium]
MTTVDTHAPATSAGGGLATVADWITSTDHKKIGRLYLGLSSLALLGAVVVAALLAFERADSSTDLLPVESLTQLFSAYRFGLTFLVALPLMVGIALVVVPLQVGARSNAFPRVAAAGFWSWAIGAVLAVIAIAANGGPNGGNRRFVDLFTLSFGLVALGIAATALSLAATVLTARAPGMNMRRIPWFSWAVLVSSLALLVVLPIVIGDLLYVYLAHRYPSTSELSGNRALGRWVGFGLTQPTTLVFALPVLGFLADVVATATNTRLRPRGVVLGTIGIVGTAMFAAAVQAPVVIRSGFSGLTGGQKVSDLIPFALVHLLPLAGVFLTVALVAGALRTKPTIGAPLLFALLGSLLLLLGAAAGALNHIGDAGLVGTTFEEGAWLAVVYGAVLAALGGVAHWMPKWTGRTMPLKATLPLALLGFLGAVLASVPMMIAGFADQPGDALPAIEAGLPGATNFSYSGPSSLWNSLSGVGHVLVLLAVLAFLALELRSASKGERAGDDPWNGQTLEWATTSPAPEHNFVDIHVVKSAEPLLDLKPSNRSDA